MRLLRSYSFTTKDPIIDRLRTLKARVGLKNGEIAKISGLSESTLAG